VDKSALHVVVRQYAAARDVVCSAHDYLPDVAVRHNVAGGARELHGPMGFSRGYPPFYSISMLSFLGVGLRVTIPTKNVIKNFKNEK
jgi:hypothetical protein